MRNLTVLALAGALLALPATASAETWQVDASHTHVGFKVRHMMVSWVKGDFGSVSGAVDYVPGDTRSLSVDVTVDMSSIDTNDDKRDEHLVGPDFFDVASHPNMTFTSRKVKENKDGSFALIGDLTLRGVTREISLDVDGMTPVVVDPWGNQRVGASASGLIDRQEFGVSWSKSMDAGGAVVGDEVALVIDVELTRKP